MSAAPFPTTSLPPGRAVFGVPLQPLRIGHALLLLQVRCRLVMGDCSPEEARTRPLRLRSVLIGVEVCRQQAIRLPSDTRIRWLELAHFRWTKLGRAQMEGRYLDAAQAFRDYWREHFLGLPGIWQNRDNGAAITGRLEGLCHAWIRHTGMSRAETLRVPVALALRVVLPSEDAPAASLPATRPAHLPSLNHG